MLAPVALAAMLFVALRRARGIGRSASSPSGTEVRPLSLLAGIALAALLVLCWRYPYARTVVGTQAPETSWLARQWSGATTVARHNGNAPGLTFAPDPARSARIESLAPPADFRHDNVVVLMLESVPWSRLFGPLARPEATPRMNALAAESIVFARAYATATHSDYAQTSILAALHPRKFERHDYSIDLAYPRTLIWDLLRPAGYRTALFSCQNEGWGNMQAFLRTPGLELFRHSPDWPRRRGAVTAPESKVFEPTPVAAFRDWLQGVKEGPFLAYLNFQATHYPYVSARRRAALRALGDRLPDHLPLLPDRQNPSDGEPLLQRPARRRPRDRRGRRRAAGGGGLGAHRAPRGLGSRRGVLRARHADPRHDAARGADPHRGVPAAAGRDRPAS